MLKLTIPYLGYRKIETISEMYYGEIKAYILIYVLRYYAMYNQQRSLIYFIRNVQRLSHWAPLNKMPTGVGPSGG